MAVTRREALAGGGAAVLAVLAWTAEPRAQMPTLPPGASIAVDRCAALPSLRLPDVRLTEVSFVPANPAAAGPVHVAHCRATGVIGAEIGFMVWLPENWNDRFLMVGGGGYVGNIPGPGPGVDRGYAVASTDTGHKSDGTDARWALQNLERQVNFAYLAIHRAAETAKYLVHEYYSRNAHHAYFSGCSTGGRQALMEAQRFPGDFDGIAAGAPVFDWTRVLAAGIKNSQAAFPDQASLAKPIVTADNLKLVQDSALKACDALDGVTDGVIDDPVACRFDLATVAACANDVAGADCLTRAERRVFERVYAPLTDDQGIVYEGQPVGVEAGAGSWQTWITGNERAAAAGQPTLGWGFSTQFFKNFVFADPAWDYTRYDVAKNWRHDSRVYTALMNADSPDLSAFRGHKGKLLLWHGWADPALNPLATIRYYKDVVARDPRAVDDVRLFLLPGVLHCGGGPGPGPFDPVAPLVDWVEKGIAPSELVARKAATPTQPARSRPVCAYPAKASYKGTGSTDDAANFICK
ncbi:MAG TPA: tannase/feruloyl esterase family alpha/beta hydrolase [Vicinamibacterales bacterium]|nr:tannase/feruloyl esterase family alpha/beta hydrolase [Vicinamibacterales bacterium]